MAPVGVDRGLELLAAARAAARIRGDDDVAVGREPLPLVLERVLELADRAAVDPQDGRVLLPRLVVGRLHDEAVDLGAVLALELRLLDRAEPELREPVVVLAREARAGRPSRRRRPRRACVASPARMAMRPSDARREARDDAAPVHEALDRSARRTGSSRGGRPGRPRAGRGSPCRRA